jgi:hypothetical protein
MRIFELIARRRIVSAHSSANTAEENPAFEYDRRLKDQEQHLAGIRLLHQRLWIYLIASALAGVIVGYLAISSHLSPLWILLPLALIVSIVQSLTKNARVHSRVQKIVRFYQLGTARLSHRWQGSGDSGMEFLPDDHPYASDLDLFGAGSLFELLCTARTGSGRAMLARWLLNPAEPDEVTNRQLAVAELRDRLDFREEWASVGEAQLGQGESSAIADWADAPASDFPLYARALALILPICFVVLSILVGLGFVAHHGPLAIAFPIGLEALLAVSLLKKTRSTTANIVLPSFGLAVVSPLLECFEGEQFRCPLLKSLQSRLIHPSGRPSRQIRILSLWVWLLDLRQSEYFAVPSSLILWGTNLAILIERWRQRNRSALSGWLESLGQFEALLCLARHYYENPDRTFAIVKPHSSALFEADALGHPLLDPETCVQCDLTLDAHGSQLVMVSGSNMSGKSTLLRSVGINSVLALAGAPVRAARLEISCLQIGCSIAVHDSLRNSKSRFQSEVERLKWIMDLARANNVLFLLDEMLGGTNSQDRFFGAKATIAELTKTGAIGIVTTHDLALAELVKVLDGHAINVHFEEHYENGEMRFDYRMRPGALTRTNGLNVIAALGLLPLSNE